MLRTHLASLAVRHCSGYHIRNAHMDTLNGPGFLNIKLMLLNLSPLHFANYSFQQEGLLPCFAAAKKATINVLNST